VPILLQKSQIAQRQFFRSKTKHIVVADKYGTNAVTEVISKFVTRG
jgi:hypothetical protein